ncbi:hypothetical protein ACFLZX_01430 [Nanoarchaeota archaeon]
MASIEFANKATFGTLHIRYKGVWNMNDLYSKMADWFRKRKYNFYEKTYKHKAPSPFGKDRQYQWDGVRIEEDYYKFIINIYMHCYDVSDFEAKKPDGTSDILTKGRIWIEMTGRIDLDYDNKFEESKFYANLRNFYNNYVLKKRVEHILWDQLWYREILKLHELIEKTLKMHTTEHEHRHFTGVHQ